MRLEFHDDAIQAILKGPAVSTWVDDTTRRIATHATKTATVPGAKYEADSLTGHDRHHGIVTTANYAARRDESANRTLTRALGLFG